MNKTELTVFSWLGDVLLRWCLVNCASLIKEIAFAPRVVHSTAVQSTVLWLTGKPDKSSAAIS